MSVSRSETGQGHIATLYEQWIGFSKLRLLPLARPPPIPGIGAEPCTEGKPSTMAYSCSSSTVKLKEDTSKTPNTGTLSGSAAISDGSKTVATIPASGTMTKGNSNFSTGSNGGWTLYVTWGSDGTVTGSANNGAGSSTNVPVAVDHPGEQRHHHASGSEAKG